MISKWQALDTLQRISYETQYATLTTSESEKTRQQINELAKILAALIVGELQ